MALAYLGTLDPVYFLVRPQIMESSPQIMEISAVSSVETSLLEDCLLEMTSDTDTTTSDQFALAAQGRQTAGGYGGGHAAIGR